MPLATAGEESKTGRRFMFGERKMMREMFIRGGFLVALILVNVRVLAGDSDVSPLPPLPSTHALLSSTSSTTSPSNSAAKQVGPIKAKKASSSLNKYTANVTSMKIYSTRGQLKTQKSNGDHRNHLVMNESEYGTYLGLRPVENMKPVRNAWCTKRKSDGKFACYPDVIYIGTSKSGTTSMAAHLANHPMVQNILSEAICEKKRSKEGHFWEREKVGRRINSTHLNMWINFTKTDIIEQQEGFWDVENRPVLIEYSPNYLVLDHVPALLRSQFKYKLKFIVSLRNPVSRTISSWKFKAKEGIKLGNVKDDLFNVSVAQGIDQSRCIINCYNRTHTMKRCSMTNCRAQFDQRYDGRNGKYSYYAHVVKSLYAYQFLLWFAYYPKSDFFIFTIEQYKKNPIGVLEALLNFLGLPLYDPEGKYGFRSKKELLNVLSVIMNETPDSSVLDQQITNSDSIGTLKDFFASQDAKLKEVLNWEEGYFD